jgi:hypothetical protein
MNPSFVRRCKFASGRGDTIHAVPGLSSEVAIGVALAALEERGQWTPPEGDYPRDADVLATVAALRKHAPEIFVEPPPPGGNRRSGPGGGPFIPGRAAR